MVYTDMHIAILFWGSFIAYVNLFALGALVHEKPMWLFAAAGAAVWWFFGVPDTLAYYLLGPGTAMYEIGGLQVPIGVGDRPPDHEIWIFWGSAAAMAWFVFAAGLIVYDRVASSEEENSAS